MSNVASESAVDLTGFLPANTVMKEIMKPGGIEGTGWMVELAGPGHPKVVEFDDAAARKSLRRAAQLEAQQANNRKVKPEEKDLEEFRKENMAFVVSRIVGWTPVKAFGKTWEFSDANAIELLSKPEMRGAFTQILEWIGDERTFTKGSATT